MKIIKFISVMLVLCTICLSGCTIGKTTTTTTTTTTTAKKDDPPKADGELNEMLELIEKDAESNSKIEFWIEYEELHFELKNSGLYDEDEWSDSAFLVVIVCDYEKATNEEWYKQCTQTDVQSINEAFYNQFGSKFAGGTYSNVVFIKGMHFVYSSLEEFQTDYDVIKSMSDLEYVTNINIGYQYGLPRVYVQE